MTVERDEIFCQGVVKAEKSSISQPLDNNLPFPPQYDSSQSD